MLNLKKNNEKFYDAVADKFCKKSQEYDKIKKK